MRNLITQQRGRFARLTRWRECCARLRALSFLALVAVEIAAVGGNARPTSAAWLYTQRGTGCGVKDVGMLVRDSEGNLIVLARAGQLANLGEDHELPATDAFGAEDRLLAKYGPDKRAIFVRKVGEAEFPLVTQLVSDRTGNLYGVGCFHQDVRLLGEGAVLRFSHRGEGDFLLVKWKPDSALAFAHQLGGPGHEYAYGLAVNRQGNILLVGEFRGTLELASAMGTITRRRQDQGCDFFLAELDHDGRCVWTRQIGGAESITPPAIALDQHGNCLVTGGFETILRFEGATEPSIMHGGGAWDFFLAKYAPDGRLVGARHGGGPTNDYGSRVLLDEAGYSYVTGRYGRDARFGAGRSEVRLEADGVADMFMACYDRAGNLLGALRVGGGGPTVDPHWTIVLDELGNRYLVAGTRQTVKVWPAGEPTDIPGTQRAPMPTLADAAVAGITNPPSRFDSISRNPDGSIQIVLEGYRDGTYVVEASVDLSTWMPVSTNRVRGGRILIEDRQAAEVPMRFYRLRQP